ncbi:MBL fold metallo-hydrolase [Cognatiyoonia sp. IB215446]|uniref:MBL fold metallo-hydrolase n=1 Tax=Cognatiyoonia sp. IB215446 TaxID=3097355 RepID=UPI002A124311|nr:MBL fold metallo-hydrolase [Cognatiyoonia sp. IB215446]MDX8350453.1 MBL fold metallo-hydrolase [Cognatiyoonia sp. IB215446]
MKFVEIRDALFQATRRGVNVYLWDRGREALLFDTGEPAFARPLARALERASPVRAILLTHCHYDHAGSAATLSNHLSASVFASDDDAALLSQGKWRRDSVPSPTVLGHVLTRLVARRYPEHIAPVERIEALTMLKTELGIEIETLPLPGHCAGQVAYGLPIELERRAWIVGDVIMTIAGIREPILYEDRAVGLASIQKLARKVQPGDVVCPGHGPALDVTQEVIDKLQRLTQG